MTILRIIIENESFIESKWNLIDGTEDLGSGSANIPDILALDGYDAIEIYLAPSLASIFKADVAHISDKKANDELLLGLVEDYLVDDIENCKPLLMRLSDGLSYIAVLNLAFYQKLIQYFSDNVKLVKFIQPIPFITHYEEGQWTVCLTNEYKFVRTSQFEYYLLDDGDGVSDTLKMMLDGYDKESLVIYAQDQQIITALENEHKLLCRVESHLNYGNLIWNFYNEKSKRFNYKLTTDNKKSLQKSLKIFGMVSIIYVVLWLFGLGYLIVDKYRLQSQITKTLTGLVKVDSYQSNLLSKVNDQLAGLAHTKGYYSNQDFTFLMNEFLQNVPDINQSMIVGVKYSGSNLDVFLNSQFQNQSMDNFIEILKTKRIEMSVVDYNSYQSASQTDGKSNNGGGVLDDNKAQNLQNTQWVVSLHEINMVDARK